MPQYVEKTEHPWERILIYGDPSTGKTRLATSLTDRFGAILYIDSDNNKGMARSILKEHQPRIRPIKPFTGSDPIKDAFEIVVGNVVPDMTKMFPEIKTLVWDTFSTTAERFLQHIANTGQHSSGHTKIGPKSEKPGEGGAFNIPTMYDYGPAQNLMANLRQFLFDLEMHVIVVCHAGYDDPEDGDPEFGPTLVGNKQIRQLPKYFAARLHTVKRVLPPTPPSIEPGEEVTVWTVRHGKWTAGLWLSDEKNPIPKVIAQPNPVNFWREYDKVVLGG